MKAFKGYWPATGQAAVMGTIHKQLEGSSLSSSCKAEVLDPIKNDWFG